MVMFFFFYEFFYFIEFRFFRLLLCCREKDIRKVGGEKGVVKMKRGRGGNKGRKWRVREGKKVKSVENSELIFFKLKIFLISKCLSY